MKSSHLKIVTVLGCRTIRDLALEMIEGVKRGERSVKWRLVRFSLFDFSFCVRDVGTGFMFQVFD